MSDADPARVFHFLKGDSELAGLIARFDWSATTLGPVDSWPATIRSVVGMILHSPLPIVTLWGEPGIMIYNDAYSVFAERATRNCSAPRFARAGPRSPISTTTSSAPCSARAGRSPTRIRS